MTAMDTARHPSHRPSPVARAPRLCAICAAMMLACAFAANSASAQTQAECPAGQTRLTKVFGFGVSDTGCVADDALKILRDCEDKGWSGLKPARLAPPPARQAPKALAKRFALMAEWPPTAHRLS